MKKYIGTLLAGVTLMAALPMAAQAADTAKNTEAQVELTQDESKKDITLDQVPSLDMGTYEIQNTTETYNAEAVTGAIKVTNPGNEEGWDVQVSGTDFVDGDKTLRGAKLTLTNGQTTADDELNASALPESGKVTVNGNNQSIVTAKAGTGIGQFTTTHDTKDVSLLVPAGNSAGTYKSTLTWTLTNAPS